MLTKKIYLIMIIAIMFIQVLSFKPIVNAAIEEDYILFQDIFDNSSTNNWLSSDTTKVSIVQVEGQNVCRLNATNNATVLNTIGSVNWKNYSVYARVMPNSQPVFSASMAIVFRYIDAKNFMYLKMGFMPI